jgi:hypothetical protein
LLVISCTQLEHFWRLQKYFLSQLQSFLCFCDFNKKKIKRNKQNRNFHMCTVLYNAGIIRKDCKLRRLSYISFTSHTILVNVKRKSLIVTPIYYIVLCIICFFSPHMITNCLDFFFVSLGLILFIIQYKLFIYFWEINPILIRMFLLKLLQKKFSFNTEKKNCILYRFRNLMHQKSWCISINARWVSWETEDLFGKFIIIFFL